MLKEAGEHWKFAMDHPEQTKPEMIGKQIPGGVGDNTLTRMYSKRHQTEYNRNRSKTSRVCAREFANEDRTGKQCDEFPFASTWQGSSTNGSDNFSIRLISADSNEAAGRWLGAWYAYDRVLDGDPFQVEVEAPEKLRQSVLKVSHKKIRTIVQAIISLFKVSRLTRQSYSGKSSMDQLMSSSML